MDNTAMAKEPVRKPENKHALSSRLNVFFERLDKETKADFGAAKRIGRERRTKKVRLSY